MIYGKIESLLTGHVATVPNLPDWQHENTRYAARTNNPFIRTTLLPAENVIMSVGTTGISKYQGLYQIDCFIGQDNGSSTALSQADTILAAFKEGLKLTDGTITVEVITASIQTAYPFEMFYCVPIVIRWQCLYSKT